MAEDPSRGGADDDHAEDPVPESVTSSRADDDADDRSGDDGWTAPLATGGDGGDRPTDDRSDDPDGGAEEDGAYAPEPNSAPVEPGVPSLENAVFVLLGALAMVAVIFRMVSLGFG